MARVKADRSSTKVNAHRRIAALTALARRELGHPISAERYVAKAGDTRSGIPSGFGRPTLHQLNRALIGADPNKIRVGQVLRLP